MKEIKFESTHKLEFYCRLWNNPIMDILMEAGKKTPYQILEYKVGTVTGQYYINENDKEMTILSVFNHSEGNGHVRDVFEWFENTCKEYKYNLVVTELMNNDFRDMLMKNGFFIKTHDSVIKYFI